MRATFRFGSVLGGELLVARAVVRCPGATGIAMMRSYQRSALGGCC
jgi:hypothetical protein